MPRSACGDVGWLAVPRGTQGGQWDVGWLGMLRGIQGGPAVPKGTQGGQRCPGDVRVARHV